MATTGESFNQALNGCYRFVPCLADPGRRSDLGLKAALLMLHVIYIGVLFLFDNDFIQNTKQRPWYTGLYLLLLFVTLVQYFFTSGSSPGYVLDAMRSWNEKNAAFTRETAPSKQPASSKNRSLGIESQTARSFVGSNVTSWAKLVLDKYPPGTYARSITCSYCHIEQPPRAKHCHDCDKCVLQFDHHCVWLGTCIGQRNHCRFWWYICEETALSVWTAILYILCLKEDAAGVWWKAGIMILLLITLFFLLIFLLLLVFFHSYLILTNQTTYELVRHRRITYLRGIPDRLHPFSQGICRNLYNFCCANSSAYNMERLPTAIELEEQSRPYTCSDCLTCRCC